MTNADKNQPLFIPPEERVTLDELKHRAEQVQDLAVDQGKRVVKTVYDTDFTKAMMVVAGVVVVAASVAYLIGSAAGRRAMSAGME